MVRSAGHVLQGCLPNEKHAGLYRTSRGQTGLVQDGQVRSHKGKELFNARCELFEIHLGPQILAKNLTLES